MDVASFENARWRLGAQAREFRHGACVELIRKGSVLDLGCGDGLLLSLLRERGIDGKGIDASPEAVQRARARGHDAEVAHLSGRIPFPDDEFDTVTLLDVLEHVYDPLSLLREATRVSKRDVIVSVPNFSSLPARVQMLLGDVPENNRPNKGHVYWFNERVFRRLIEASGLAVRELRMNTFRPASFFGSALPRLSPGLFALSFVARLEK